VVSALSDASVRRLAEVANLPDLSETRYTLLEEIGRGGAAAVYRARDETLGREVAIKVSSAPGGREDLDARMRTEATVLAALEHPGIVPVHDAGILPDGRAFYVMKRVRGTLLREMARGTAGLDERLRILERVCETMAFAHARGIVHRDLKPENVMVGGSARSWSSTGAWRGCPAPLTNRARCWGRPATWHPSRPRGGRGTRPSARTSTRWAPSCARS
jgi:serine/threonine protein kinase